MFMRPIWQAPTGSIAGPELCAAVTLAGGVGGMGFTWTPPEAAEATVRQVADLVGGQPFQANFALAFPPRALRAALEMGVPIVTFSWGDPTPYVELCQGFGAHVGVQVTSVEEARRAVDLEVQALIVQGVEAGGHVQSSTALFELLPAIVQLPEVVRSEIPVVAAGGLANGKDVRRVWDIGAEGAMLGTRFVATRESLAHDTYKRALLAASETELTGLFDLGWPDAAHRVLRNSTFHEWDAAGRPASGRRPNEGQVVGQAPGGPILRYEDTAPGVGFTGEIEAMCLYAGTGVGRITDLPTAAELVARLLHEAATPAPSES